MNFFSKVAARLRPEPSETLTGYEHPELIDVIFRKTVAYSPADRWREIPDARTVLDFGGGCGLHYKQAKSASVRWAVVETPAMAERAAELSTDHLRFFSSIQKAAAWLGEVDMIHSDGALQYTVNPAKTLAELCAIDAGTVLWRRVNLSQSAPEIEIQRSHLADNGPGRARGIADKLVSYKITRIPERDFLAAHSGYRLAERGPQSFRFVRVPG